MPSQKKISSIIENTDKYILAGFITETLERLDKADQHLLALEAYPGSESQLNALFRIFHTIKGDAQVISYEEMSDLAHATEDVLGLARNGNIILSGTSLNIVFDSADILRRLTIFLGSEDKELISGQEVSYLISRIRQTVRTERHRKLGDILVESGHISPDVLARALRQQEEEELAKPDNKTGAFSTGENTNILRKSNAMIRIDPARLDKLLFLDKIIHDILETGNAMRMTPIRSTFDKMARVARGLAKNSGKEIEFSVTGEETELDRSIVEIIRDPLIHLVRNAIDHGIENPCVRKAGTKPEKGKVSLCAFQRGGSVFIEVADDGSGLDRNKIFDSAVKLNMVRPVAILSDEDFFNMIFRPGFSTAEKVSSLSGRGVGMDVVKQKINALHGNIELSSEKGVGTRISIRLPLTLASMEGVIVRVGEDRYIIPSLIVIEAVRLKFHKVLIKIGNGEVIDFHGNLVPFLSLSNLFSDQKNVPAGDYAVIAEAYGKPVALHVDELLGQRQFVFKKLGGILSKAQYVSGTVIMPDGCVAFVLDIDKIAGNFMK
ncbi:MAG: chemotaxis protein CheA [Desulfobacteraceae bacterium]|nr:chemotaxis protein CheA [Desulfobacteraceae bacterium]